MTYFESLTDSEEIVMKAVWDFKNPPVLSDIVERVNGVYGKNWRPQTVSTFLSKLCRKDYLELHRNGKVYTYTVNVKEPAYRRKLYKHHISFWNDNDALAFVGEMLENGDLTKEDIQSLL